MEFWTLMNVYVSQAPFQIQSVWGSYLCPILIHMLYLTTMLRVCHEFTTQNAVHR